MAEKGLSFACHNSMGGVRIVPLRSESHSPLEDGIVINNLSILSITSFSTSQSLNLKNPRSDYRIDITDWEEIDKQQIIENFVIFALPVKRHYENGKVHNDKQLSLQEKAILGRQLVHWCEILSSVHWVSRQLKLQSFNVKVDRVELLGWNIEEVNPSRYIQKGRRGWKPLDRRCPH